MFKCHDRKTVWAPAQEQRACATGGVPAVLSDPWGLELGRLGERWESAGIALMTPSLPPKSFLRLR